MGVKIIKSFIVIILLVMCSYIVTAAIYNRGWSTPQTILKEPWFYYGFSIMGGTNGSWHLIYSIDVPSDDPYPTNIKYLNSNSEHYTIAKTDEPLISPSADIGQDGRIHVAYFDYDSTEKVITLKYMYKDSQAQWSLPQTILKEPWFYYGFSIMGGTNGSWHLIYVDFPHDDDNLYHIKYLNSNSEHYTIAKTNEPLISPSADIGQDGRIHVAYFYIDHTEEAITLKYMYKDSQAQWSEPQTILKGKDWFFYGFSISGAPDGSWHIIHGSLPSPGDYLIPIEYLNSNSEYYTIAETYEPLISFFSFSDAIDIGQDGRIHVAYFDYDSTEKVITIKYMYKSTDKLRLLIIPVNWQGSYTSFKTKAKNISKYYLERIPLKDCPEQFEVLISEEKDYGPSWKEWYCFNPNMIPPNCDDSGLLAIIDKCASQYKARTDKRYDYVVGITDRDLKKWNRTGTPIEPNCDSSVAGWSDGKGGTPAVIAEATIPGVVTHELGHEFALADEYCDCSGTPYYSYCGPIAPYNPLRISLGCNYTGDCCEIGGEVYPGCYKWCYGNYDQKWSQGIGNQRSTMSNRILPYDPNCGSGPGCGMNETGYYDINEYSHLKTISQFKCDSSKVLTSSLTTMSTTTNNKTTSVYTDSLLTISLIVFNNDTVMLSRIDVSFGYTPIIYPEEGDYSLRVLDIDNNPLYSRNMSLDFILFSDPPEIVNYSYIYDKIPLYYSMRKLELYHGNNLIFSQELDFCNYNDNCDENENYYSCPVDCLPYEKDGICNKEKDDGCDLDCLPGIDPDCSIFLQPGWNLISIPFNISNKTVKWLCNQINCTLIFAFPNQTWKYYNPTKSVNTLDNIDEKIGLWIKVNKSSELNLEGSSFENVEINLSKGWNLIGYPLLYTSSINETLKDINLSIVYNYKDNKWYSYIKGRGDSLNSLKSLKLGYGYWVKSP